mmetsp:Transcript_155/g.423  ORF Transcript_155/g.423 Transcript_155/m.423 type:complete len:211 (+) Transcript_155:368-1000(+)
MRAAVQLLPQRAPPIRIEYLTHGRLYCRDGLWTQRVHGGRGPLGELLEALRQHRRPTDRHHEVRARLPLGLWPLTQEVLQWEGVVHDSHVLSPAHHGRVVELVERLVHLSEGRVVETEDARGSVDRRAVRVALQHTTVGHDSACAVDVLPRHALAAGPLLDAMGKHALDSRQLALNLLAKQTGATWPHPALALLRPTQWRPPAHLRHRGC